VKTLEESFEREQQTVAKLHQKHAEELNHMEKEMREQLNSERERLLNQIRELTVMKKHATTEVCIQTSETCVSS
jgi:F0F1-type ATP synthase membrane subunit b/b'